MKMGLSMVLVGHVNFMLGALVHGVVLRHINLHKQARAMEYAVSNVFAITSGLVVSPRDHDEGDAKGPFRVFFGLASAFLPSHTVSTLAIAALSLSPPPRHRLCSRWFVFKAEAAPLTSRVSSLQGVVVGILAIILSKNKRSRCLVGITRAVSFSPFVSAFCSHCYMALILFDVFLKPPSRGATLTFDQANSFTRLVTCRLRCRQKQFGLFVQSAEVERQ